MSDKPGLNVATGFQGGVTVGISADSWEDFVSLCRDVYGAEDGLEVAEGLYGRLKAQATATTDSIFAAVVQSLGGTTAPPDGQYTAPPTAGGPPPGQTHDPKDPSKTKWVKGGVSKTKTNPDGTPKAFQGFWATP